MMTREEAMRIIEEEELRHYNLFEEHGPRKWDLGIKKRGSQWVVYKVDERDVYKRQDQRRVGQCAGAVLRRTE